MVIYKKNAKLKIEEMINVDKLFAKSNKNFEIVLKLNLSFKVKDIKS